MMKRLVFYFGLLLVFAACSSEDIPVDDRVVSEESEEMNIDTKKYDVSLTVKGDSTSFFKKANNESRVVEMNEVYLIADYNKPSREAVKLAVTPGKTTEDGEMFGQLHFMLSQNKKGDIYVSGPSGGKAVMISEKRSKGYNYKLCVLSSTPDMKANMTDAAVSSEAGKPTLAPYRDRLFLSQTPFRIGYRKIDKWSIFKNPYYAYIFHLADENSTEFAATETSMKREPIEFVDNNSLFSSALVYEMERYTTSIQVNFCIVDWMNDHNLEPLRESDFFDAAGTTADNWEVRTFLESVATSFDMYEYKSNNTILKGNGLLSVCDGFESFAQCRVERKDAAPDVIHALLTIDAVGLMHSERAGEIFILPMKNNDSHLYFTIHSKDLEFKWEVGIWPWKEKKSVTYHEYRTLRIPLSHLKVDSFKPNDFNELLVIISLKDFLNAMDVNGDIEAKSRGAERVRTVHDPVFGEVVDIPYKVVVRKIEDKNTEKN